MTRVQEWEISFSFTAKVKASVFAGDPYIFTCVMVCESKDTENSFSPSAEPNTAVGIAQEIAHGISRNGETTATGNGRPDGGTLILSQTGITAMATLFGGDSKVQVLVGADPAGADAAFFPSVIPSVDHGVGLGSNFGSTLFNSDGSVYRSALAARVDFYLNRIPPPPNSNAIVATVSQTTQVIGSLLGKTFAAGSAFCVFSGSMDPYSAGGGGAPSLEIVSFGASEFQITPRQFWQYGGLRNPANGEPAINPGTGMSYTIEEILAAPAYTP